MTFDDPFETVLMWENEHYLFYHDSWCNQFRKNLAHYDNNGYAVDVKEVYLAMPKDGGKGEYVAFDTRGKPFLSWKDSWDFEVCSIMYKSMLKEDNDIVNMAKRKKEVS